MGIYNSDSPYYSTDVKDGYLDVINFRNIQGQADDLIYEIEPRYEHRPDLLAYELYGNVKLWWIFAVRNKDIIKDPVYDIVPGVSIYVPSLTYIRSVIGN
jgi:hypothetical protein